MTRWFAQSGYGVRFEWGLSGARHVASGAAGVVIVDVLSFTTSVSVAVEAGTHVLPYAWRDETARDFAEQHDAALAVGRRQVSEANPWSLSPAALQAAPFTERLVLPSPNGSTIAREVRAAASSPVETSQPAGRQPVLVAGCLRNATATARWLTAQGLATPDRPVAVIASGERWPDGSLRPALEDLLGAGGIIAALDSNGCGPLSPEAAAAAAAFRHTPDVPEAVRSCGGGKELIDGGFAEDVEIAIEIDQAKGAAVLFDEAFVLST
ncbi:MAG TPA: 2-phosphosulfolactate phosphatase [Actinopolymorphaceae bacterium]|jgi:2-phosphosulfolactate phosphatase